MHRILLLTFTETIPIFKLYIDNPSRMDNCWQIKDSMWFILTYAVSTPRVVFFPFALNKVSKIPEFFYTLNVSETAVKKSV